MNDSEMSFNGELQVTVDGTVLLFYCITHCNVKMNGNSIDQTSLKFLTEHTFL